MRRQLGQRLVVPLASIALQPLGDVLLPLTDVVLCVVGIPTLTMKRSVALRAVANWFLPLAGLASDRHGSWLAQVVPCIAVEPVEVVEQGAACLEGGRCLPLLCLADVVVLSFTHGLLAATSVGCLD